MVRYAPLTHPTTTTYFSQIIDGALRSANTPYNLFLKQVINAQLLKTFVAICLFYTNLFNYH